jgi:hypothetical protein
VLLLGAVAQVIFTAEVCEALYSVPKTLASQIAWRQSDARTYLFAAKVLTTEGDVLDLSGYWSRNDFHNRTRWGFALRYLGHLIRSWDMSTKHKNPTGPRIRGPHKHKFDSSKVPRLAYKPNPALSDRDPNQSLMDFLEESNIQPPPEYQNVMFPSGDIVQPIE